MQLFCRCGVLGEGVVIRRSGKAVTARRFWVQLRALLVWSPHVLLVHVWVPCKYHSFHPRIKKIKKRFQIQRKP